MGSQEWAVGWLFLKIENQLGSLEVEAGDGGADFGGGGLEG